MNLSTMQQYASVHGGMQALGVMEPKLVLMGAVDVGKSALTQQYVYSTFTQNKECTVGSMLS